MNVEGGDPACTGLEDLDQKLAGEIVATDGALVGDEQDWLGGVEVGGLRGTTTLETAAEGELGEMLGEGVDGDRNGGGG